jgi:hypothetical protein
MTRRALPLAPELAARMQALRARGASFDLIASSLNQSGVPAHHGGRWFAATVRLALLKSGAPPAPQRNDS